MCGFTGILDCARNRRGDALASEAERMAATLAHRGPDGAGSWIDAASGIALAHRRLAILDLSPAGAQPMRSRSGRYTIAYNGEIYNHDSLRKELLALDRSVTFRGRSDTEVMLAAFEQWGFEAGIARLYGMFAFALWDAAERCIYLARDRFGEKPLYYGWIGRKLIFGSELKALRATESFPSAINRDALSLYFRFNCIPAPYTIYSRVHKLPPANYLRVSAQDPSTVPVEYWSLRSAAKKSIEDPFIGDEREAVQQLDELLQESVSAQMIADEPLGAFLSGGIDSSLIVALMQRNSSRPVQTFSIGLRDSYYDEAANAQAVAAHIGSEHTELYLEPAQAMEVIPELAAVYDEPFADSSQIPTLLLARLARQKIKVALSGDGGDEIFGGYNRHVWMKRLWNWIRWMPPPMRAAFSRTAIALPARRLNRLFAAIAPALPASLQHRLPGDKLHKLAPLLKSKSARELYRGAASHWDDPGSLVVNAIEPAAMAESALDDFKDFTAEIMFLDSVSFLPDDVLTKVDRASMACGLEVRAPYLDHQLAEFAWRLPMHMKIRSGKGKWILRRLLGEYVPEKLWERPKMGFGIPLDEWLRGPLRSWAEDLLSEGALRREGFLHPLPVRQKWQEHLSGRRDWQYPLWDVLMFQSWLQSIHAQAPQTCAIEAGA